jgi:hypothetical protein
MRKDVSLNNYRRILFSLDMTTVYQPAHSKERCGGKNETYLYLGIKYLINNCGHMKKIYWMKLCLFYFYLI